MAIVIKRGSSSQLTILDRSLHMVVIADIGRVLYIQSSVYEEKRLTILNNLCYIVIIAASMNVILLPLTPVTPEHTIL